MDLTAKTPHHKWWATKTWTTKAWAAGAGATGGVLLVVALAGLLLLSCHNSNQETAAMSGEAKVDSVVAHHFAVLDSSLKPVYDKPIDLEEFGAAVYFMMAVTGIDCQGISGIVGPYKVERDEVRQWKTWIAEHRSSLRWDPVGDSVIVVK